VAYVLALNDLMREDGGAGGKRRRRDIAGVEFLSWTREPSDFDVFASLDPPDVATVEALRMPQPIESDSTQLYMAGISCNGARLRIRYWVNDSLDHIKDNLRQWREQLRIFYPWDDPGPVRLRQLLYAIDRDGKPLPHHTLALLRRAIQGTAQPLGHATLAVVLGRLRRPDGINTTASKATDSGSLSRLRVPMGLVRLCLNDIQRAKGANKVSEGLDPNCPIPAYICGRLMAEFENLQRAASEGWVNASVLDRYFSLASTCPVVAFPKIENLGQMHLRKLKRAMPGVAYAIESRLQELHDKLAPADTGPFPGNLDLVGQGLFVLGYYHQKASSFARAPGRKQSGGSSSADKKRKIQDEHN
jgi:CRISPR-associated protein Csd1